MGSILSALTGGGADEKADTKSPEPSRVTMIHSSKRWHHHFNSCKESNTLMVVDFTASWCRPCRMMVPVFNAMSAEYSDVEFFKIDVDELRNVARVFGVQAMPTFVLFKQGKEVERVVGAETDELAEKIQQHRPSSNI